MYRKTDSPVEALYRKHVNDCFCFSNIESLIEDYCSFYDSDRRHRYDLRHRARVSCKKVV
ncbi:hypothetical protein BCAR13_340013 [Paraburkholderia caribensis]|nr:hypothetical protein BCAR13_340013 [Paraburkholderia caribensis]